MMNYSDQDTPEINEFLPNRIRGIFCGPSSYGKTNAFVALFTDPNDSKFENFYLYSQSKYKFVGKVNEKIRGMQYSCREIVFIYLHESNLKVT